MVIKTDNDIIISNVREKDGMDFIELMNKQYPTKKKIEYFYWMYVNNFLPTILLTAYFNDRPIGFYGAQIHKLSNGINCSLSIDIILHEEYRKLGIFYRLEEAVYKFSVENNCKIMAVFPNYAGMRAHIKLNTWSSIAKIDNLEFDISNNIKDDVLKIYRGSPVHFIKDENYRKWRLDSSPVYNYKQIKVSENVYSYTKIFEDKQNKVKYGDVVEYSLENANNELNSEMIFKTLSSVKENGCTLISIWSLPHESLYKQLIKLGFKAQPRERYFCVRIIDKDYEFLKDITNWHLVQSDTEIY